MVLKKKKTTTEQQKNKYMNNLDSQKMGCVESRISWLIKQYSPPKNLHYFSNITSYM